MDTSVIGITLTLFVIILDYYGRVLQPLDEWFYDHRARLCQFFTPKPTDKLIHVNIDDTSIQVLGKWPWPRAQFAELIDEIDRAGAKAVFMDIVFDEPSNPSPRPEKVGPNKFVEIDDDAIFADVLKRSGKCLVPVSLNLYQSPTPLYLKMFDYLIVDLELSQEECQQRLVNDKLLRPGASFPADLYVVVRRDAMNTRITNELKLGDLPVVELRKRLLPRTDVAFTGTPLFRLLNEEYNKVVALGPLRRFMMTIPEGLPPLARYTSELAPILPFSRNGAACGYVNYLQTGESGVVRAIPLFANYRDHLFPQTDLALACAVLGVDVRTLKLYPDKVVIPKPPGEDRDIVIPVRTIHAPEYDRDIGMFMDIPVRGNRDWTTIYDHPNHQKAELHLSMSALWQPHLIRERVARNNGNIDRALSTILDEDRPNNPEEAPRVAFEPSKWKQYAAALPPPEDTAVRKKFVDAILQDMKELGMVAQAGTIDGRPSMVSALDKDGKPTDPRELLKNEEFALAVKSLDIAIRENDRFEKQLLDHRAFLSKNINGRAVMVGWIATAKTDFFPTAIQPTCPGVVIHGMTFNAIMTRDFWYHVPKWVTALTTLLIGLLVTAANGLLKPSGSLIVAVLLGTLYLGVNGLLLFDRNQILVGVAGPIVALASVWSTGTLASFLIESRERKSITKRFSSYVDQKLVDYVIEHPDVKLTGQVREMSVVFTDLAGFTTLSEQLRERTVEILSKYLTVMVPVIRRNNGYVNKFLGDGIMCFYNAPEDDPDHAAHAVQTVLEMQKAMKDFADGLVAEGLPRVAMRCGVSTGTMVVGDSGPSDASDYTVLGDTVNFASRLEGANKAVGTNILISHRTTELLGDSRFLLRPVGKLLVVGKSEGVMTYEPLAPFDDATPQDMILATMGTEMIAAYFAKDFEKCIEFADKMDAQLGPTKLPGLYRKAALKYIETPPGPEFQGNLILTEK
jgi:class 3 adenylate cyclase/CHASE2 domain-containing sensor protein